MHASAITGALGCRAVHPSLQLPRQPGSQQGECWSNGEQIAAHCLLLFSLTFTFVISGGSCFNGRQCCGAEATHTGRDCRHPHDAGEKCCVKARALIIAGIYMMRVIGTCIAQNVEARVTEAF